MLTTSSDIFCVVLFTIYPLTDFNFDAFPRLHKCQAECILPACVCGATTTADVRHLRQLAACITLAAVDVEIQLSA